MPTTYTELTDVIEFEDSSYDNETGESDYFSMKFPKDEFKKALVDFFNSRSSKISGLYYMLTISSNGFGVTLGNMKLGNNSDSFFITYDPVQISKKLPLSGINAYNVSYQDKKGKESTKTVFGLDEISVYNFLKKQNYSKISIIKLGPEKLSNEVDAVVKSYCK